MLDRLLSKPKEQEKMHAKDGDGQHLQQHQRPPMLQRIQLCRTNGTDGRKVECMFAPRCKGCEADLDVFEEHAEQKGGVEEKRSRAQGHEADEAVECDGGYDVVWEALVTVVKQVCYRCD